MVRTAGVNPNTPRQSTFRQIVPFLSNAWGAQLTDAQRISWNTFASTVPVLNRLGVTTTLSGHQMFIKLNGIQQMRGQAYSASPPGSTAVSSPTSLVLVPDSALGTFKITPNVAVVAAGEHAYFFASPPMSPGKHYVSSKLRFIGAYTLNVQTDITTNYKTIFGFFPSTAGQKIFGRFYVVQYSSGIISSAIHTYAYVT
jgi:hypothetical protein